MTDSGLSIFRNLESSAGRESFDTIVRAAVANYAALRQPSVSQARDFGRLVLPVFDRTNAETRRVLAASLAASPRLPREVVERVMEQPTDICAPFLLSSPLLTAADVAALAERREPELRELLKARLRNDKRLSENEERDSAARDAGTPLDEASVLPAVVSSADVPASAPEPAERAGPPRLSSSRQTELLSAGAPLAEPKPNAAETREMLRRLARPGGAVAERGHRLPVAQAAADGGDLLSLAVARDAEPFYLSLATTLMLDGARLSRIENDRSGGELAVALKAVGLSTVDALTVLMMMKHDIGSEVAAFEAMEDFYDALVAQECAADFQPRRAAHEPLHAERERQVRSEPRRATFGRRSAVPAADLRRREPG